MISRRNQESHCTTKAWERSSPWRHLSWSEFLKIGGDASVKWLKALTKWIWNEEPVPKDRKKQIIFYHKRKGCPAECGNYCNITLLTIPSIYVFTKAIPNYLKPRFQLYSFGNIVETMLKPRETMLKPRGFQHGQGCAYCWHKQCLCRKHITKC